MQKKRCFSVDFYIFAKEKKHKMHHQIPYSNEKESLLNPFRPTHWIGGMQH